MNMVSDKALIGSYQYVWLPIIERALS